MRVLRGGDPRRDAGVPEVQRGSKRREKQKPGADPVPEDPADKKRTEDKTMTMLANVKENKVMTLADYEARIYLYKEQIGTGYIGIGRTLIEAKEAKVVPHGQWETWVTETTGLTARQAQRCMQAATEIKDGSAMARLEMSKALLLLSSGLDEETREEIATQAADEGATVKDLREQLKQAKLKLVQETGAGAEIREALKTLEAERVALEEQLKAREEAYKAQLDEAREDAYRRGEGAGKMDAAAEIREQLKAKQQEIDALKERADMNHRARMNEIASMNEREKEAKNRIAGLQNELNKQTQYAESLREELEKKQEAAVPADFAKDREILLAAAEEAEKRAADAEAELEALKAAGAGQPDPGWKVLKKAVDIFMADCELLAINDLQGLLREEAKVNATLNYLDGWIAATRQAMAGAVQAEGAVL